MCACGCFLLAAVIAALVYSVMHGLWLLAAGVLLVAGLIGWLGRKMVVPPKSPEIAPGALLTLSRTVGPCAEEARFGPWFRGFGSQPPTGVRLRLPVGRARPRIQPESVLANCRSRSRIRSR